jgi:hypothetical protein
MPEVFGTVLQKAQGEIGFIFEELITKTLSALIKPAAAQGLTIKILGEQDIRDVFNEQSLNGVDHMVDVEDASGSRTIFLLQEKWKIITNQREVSQFLDCCSRILSRIRPDRRGTVYRLWVTRSQPSANGEKSLAEGGAYVIQSMTSQPILAQIKGQFICELLGKRELCGPMIADMPSLLTTAPADPVVLDNSKTAPAPVFNYKTQVKVQKGDYYLP